MPLNSLCWIFILGDLFGGFHSIGFPHRLVLWMRAVFLYVTILHFLHLSIWKHISTCPVNVNSQCSIVPWRWSFPVQHFLCRCPSIAHRCKEDHRSVDVRFPSSILHPAHTHSRHLRHLYKYQDYRNNNLLDSMCRSPELACGVNGNAHLEMSSRQERNMTTPAAPPPPRGFVKRVLPACFSSATVFFKNSCDRRGSHTGCCCRSQYCLATAGLKASSQMCRWWVHIPHHQSGVVSLPLICYICQSYTMQGPGKGIVNIKIGMCVLCFSIKS